MFLQDQQNGKENGQSQALYDLTSSAATEASNLVRNGANDGESDGDELFNYDSDTDKRRSRASSSSERMFMEDTTT